MADISQNSARVAKNTLLLYMRMLLMMAIGLFTSRIVLKALGVDNFGIYNVVYEMVMLFTIVSNSISTAISRFMAYEIGRGDELSQRKVFSSAMIIQTMMSLLLLVLVFTAGLWYLRNVMVMPADRADAAFWVMVCSALLMVVQLYSVPFNATIIANEQMKAFAYISILEALLKLSVALLLWFGSGDVLITYAVLMLGAGLLTRSAYAIYCHRHFAITNGRWIYDGDTIRRMLSFSGWGMMGNCASVLNTKGISLVSNGFFGVGINAARGIAMQVENIVRQFINNFLTALTPQITKSWSGGNAPYSYVLVAKGCKFSYLMTLLFVVPFAFEADMILYVWLGDVPEYAATFARLVMICLLVDLPSYSLFQLVLASGRVSRYYTVISVLLSLVFAGSWIAFSAGAAPQSTYWISIAVYSLIVCSRLYFAHRETAMPAGPFVREAVLPCLAVTAVSVGADALMWYALPAGWLRLMLILCLGTIVMAAATYIIALTPGERTFVIDKAKKFFGGISSDKN